MIHPGHDQGEGLPRDQHTQHRADRGDHHRFGQQLPHDADAGRAERRAYGKLLLTMRTPDEQEDRNVGAPDEQE
jgi:hypothetical protein